MRSPARLFGLSRMRTLILGTGVAGALLVARYVALFWRVIHGPGDDNPIALVFLVAAALSCVPALGLLVALKRPPYGILPRAWLAASSLALAAVTPFALMFFL